MLYLRVIVILLIALLAFYYIMLVCHIAGWTNITNRKITVFRCIIPFYYWIADPVSKN